MYDVIIIGAGPAGISASLYAKRANLKTLIINGSKSNLETAEKIENYYGFKNGINGKELYIIGIEQAKNLGIEVIDDEVIKIEKEEIFTVKTIEKELEARVVILATGNKKNKPKIKGVKEFEGRGISYCAICDAFFYKDKKVAVLGNGSYAINEAMELMGVVQNVTILTNGEEEPQYRSDNVHVNSKEIREIRGEKRVSEVEFEDNTKIKVDAVFVAEGVAGSTDFAKEIGAITKDEKIIVNEKMETNIHGLYACGDCTGGLLQISKAVYEGTQAGIQAIQYIRKENKN